MLSKRRWALNPRKWFGSISNAARKRDKKVQVDRCVIQLPPPPPQPVNPMRTGPSAPLVPRILTSRSKTKITPAFSNNDAYSTHTKNTPISSTQLQLLTSTTNQEKSSVTMQGTTTTFRRANTLIPTRFGPSIQKGSPHGEELSINTKRRSAEIITCDASKLLSTLQFINVPQRNVIETQLQTTVPQMADQDPLDRPRISSNNCCRKSSTSRLSHSPSPSSLSIDDNDGRDGGSSSSGVFTDERAEVNERPNRKASRDTLSTLDALSVESINDSQTSLNQQNPSRQTSCQYRLPLSTFQTNDNRSARQRNETSTVYQHHRTRSAENILKDNPGIMPVVNKTRQSSAAIVKKIEKRIPPGRSSSTEKIGLIRVTNDTYRLIADKDEHLYRRRSSIVSYTNHDDSLPPADDEESYAALPRTSSTEQLSNNVQNDLRAIVDDCLRPMAAAMNKTSRSNKTHCRSKRSHINHENKQIDIEDITDRLLSSIDCSTYSQYQRCF